MKKVVPSWALNWLYLGKWGIERNSLRKNAYINEVSFGKKYCIYLFIYIYRLI